MGESVTLLPAEHGFWVDAEAGKVMGRADSTREVGHFSSRYTSVGLDRRGIKKVRAHRLIWEAVHGPIPAGMQINHINGNKRDNRIANLELVTPGDNQRHAYRTGLRVAVRGSNHYRAKFDEATVASIKTQLGSRSIASIAREHDVAWNTIWSIANGKTWKHVAAA